MYSLPSASCAASACMIVTRMSAIRSQSGWTFFDDAPYLVERFVGQQRLHVPGDSGRRELGGPRRRTVQTHVVRRAVGALRVDARTQLDDLFRCHAFGV